MTGRLWTLAAACSIAALAGCSDSKSSPSSTGPTSTGPTGSVTVAIPATSVISDGRMVTISYTNTAGGSATLTTTLGTWQSSGTSTVTVSNGAGTEALVTCATCSLPGTATVTITSASTGSTQSKQLTFISRASACQSSCSADPNCAGLVCNLTGGGNGACSAGACVAGSACTPTNGATTETSCSDGIDNDCNGLKDCGEAACDGQPCKVGSPTFQCRNRLCTDLSTGLAIDVTPSRPRLPASGGATIDVEVAVTYLTDPAANLTVSVSLWDGTLDDTLGTISPPLARTDANGRAHFTYTNKAAVGVETITARLATFPTVAASATVANPRLGSLRLVTDGQGAPQSAEFTVMGTKGSGWQDLGWLRVQAVDDLGLPYPDGLPIRFEHRVVGAGTATSASTLGSPLTADTATCHAPACVGYLAHTASDAAPDTSGVAQAWIYSGTVAGTLPVTASATAGGASYSVLLPTIAVVGAKASGSNFALACSPRNVPALAETNGSVSLVDAPFTCEAALKDRFGNVLGRETQVIFMAEAGAVGPPTWTTAYDSTKPGDGQMTLGIATQSVNTLLAGLPFDVTPDTTTSEPSWTEIVADPQFGGTLALVHNPRDGIVTVIAIADGEEGFWDANGNGSYDPGEPFVDLGEPFIDQNDNGTWDPGEWFLDLDGDHAWTGPNGTWDANTKIWTQTIVLYTGTADTLPVLGGGYLGTRIASGASTACAPSAPVATFDVFADSTTHPGGTSASLRVYASDQNLNFLNTKASYAVDAINDPANVKLTYGGLPSYADVPGLGYRYWPCDANGHCESQCRASVGNGACHMVPLIYGYTCGLGVDLTVFGVKDGRATVRWNVDVPWSEYKNGYTLRGGDSVTGVVHP